MFGSNTVSLLSKALTASTMKQSAISDNIANVDTPGYKAKGVAFEAALSEAMSSQSTFHATKTDSRHLDFQGSPSNLNPTFTFKKGLLMQSNGNNVDIDREIVDLTQNQIWHNALVQQAAGHYEKMKKVINGGK